jgi:hypothetical protein
MKDILAYFFADKPEVLSSYQKYRTVVINALLLVTITVALLTNSDNTRSLSLGFALGIVIVTMGRNLGRIEDSKTKISAGEHNR